MNYANKTYHVESFIHLLNSHTQMAKICKKINFILFAIQALSQTKFNSAVP